MAALPPLKTPRDSRGQSLDRNKRSRNRKGYFYSRALFGVVKRTPWRDSDALRPYARSIPATQQQRNSARDQSARDHHALPHQSRSEHQLPRRSERSQ
jgi:hypothetical protein